MKLRLPAIFRRDTPPQPAPPPDKQLFYDGLFGSIASGQFAFDTNSDFIPIDGSGGTLNLKDSSAQWLGLRNKTMQYWAYCFCSPLASVIDRLADSDLNGRLMIVKDDKSNEQSKSEKSKSVIKLLNNPNPLQTFEEYRGEQNILKRIFGYSLVFKVVIFDEIKYLFNLNPFFCEPVLNPKFDIYIDPNPIAYWRCSINGKTYNISSDRILLLRDGYLGKTDDTGLPLSKVAGLDYSISNICAAMEADNVLLRKKGPLGFISHEPKPDNVVGYQQMTKPEQQEVQKALTEYGLSWKQFQFVVSKVPLRWNPMSFNVRDLDTKGTIKTAIDMVCDRFSYPAELMSGKNATYENRSSSEKYLYQNVVIPANARDMRRYQEFLGLEGVILKCDFSDVPVLQESKVNAGVALKNQTDAYLIQFQNSVITLNRYRILMDEEPIEGDDIYYSEYLKKYNVTQKDSGTTKKSGDEPAA